MDIFLCASAKFMLGTSSGMSAISYIFGIPLAMTNYLPTAATYLSKRDLFLPRLMQRKDDGKMLNLVKLSFQLIFTLYSKFLFKCYLKTYHYNILILYELS